MKPTLCPCIAAAVTQVFSFFFLQGFWRFVSLHKGTSTCRIFKISSFSKGSPTYMFPFPKILYSNWKFVAIVGMASGDYLSPTSATSPLKSLPSLGINFKYTQKKVQMQRSFQKMHVFPWDKGLGPRGVFCPLPPSLRAHPHTLPWLPTSSPRHLYLPMGHPEKACSGSPCRGIPCRSVMGQLKTHTGLWAQAHWSVQSRTEWGKCSFREKWKEQSQLRAKCLCWREIPQSVCLTFCTISCHSGGWKVTSRHQQVNVWGGLASWFAEMPSASFQIYKSPPGGSILWNLSDSNYLPTAPSSSAISSEVKASTYGLHEDRNRQSALGISGQGTTGRNLGSWPAFQTFITLDIHNSGDSLWVLIIALWQPLEWHEFPQPVFKALKYLVTTNIFYFIPFVFN